MEYDCGAMNEVVWMDGLGTAMVWTARSWGMESAGEVVSAMRPTPMSMMFSFLSQVADISRGEAMLLIALNVVMLDHHHYY